MLDAIRRNVTWKAIPIAGLAAGTVFLLINMIFNPIVLGIDALFILRYFAALILGADALTDAGELIIVVGILVHYALSLLFAVVIAIIIHRWGLWVGIIGGAILGLSLYAINLYTMTVFFPWFFAINNTILAVSHVLFGAVAGGVYESLDHFDLPLMQEVQA